VWCGSDTRRKRKTVGSSGVVCLHDRTIGGARIQVLVDRLDLRPTGTKYVGGGTAALSRSWRRAPSVRRTVPQREREGPSRNRQRCSELHSGMCTCKDVYIPGVSARRGCQVGIRVQPSLCRVSPAPSVARAMNHVCALCWALTSHGWLPKPACFSLINSDGRPGRSRSALLGPCDSAGPPARQKSPRRRARQGQQAGPHPHKPCCRRQVVWPVLWSPRVGPAASLFGHGFASPNGRKPRTTNSMPPHASGRSPHERRFDGHQLICAGQGFGARRARRSVTRSCGRGAAVAFALPTHHERCTGAGTSWGGQFRGAHCWDRFCGVHCCRRYSGDSFDDLETSGTADEARHVATDATASCHGGFGAPSRITRPLVPHAHDGRQLHGHAVRTCWLLQCSCGRQLHGHAVRTCWLLHCSPGGKYSCRQGRSCVHPSPGTWAPCSSNHEGPAPTGPT